MTPLPLDIDAGELRTAQRDNLVSLLNRAHRMIESEVRAEFDERGLSHINKTHLRLLLSLDLEGVRISELTERSGLAKHTVSTHARSLARLGIIRMTPDPSDGRAKLVLLTREGMKDLLSIIEIIRIITTRYAEAIGQRRITQLHSTIGMLLG